ncbi:MAG: secondary thiamine-phosphate synthase enzyme YjbQ [Desulfarculaceae bacterium]|nr:secondary thiamine-phosphate synthase enzyme YjbQ [Desulfarculaceae bacterium]MCF8073536.1 secondary thiamine-phosphate synthase enzyme YjbQ [Desulfarculaceae bacterium]MCF8103058.1 secondary thiamine-phosphate synthase enzyme YjbQ [Desulfarculaceae bacterium]MCF8115748.1 secondary thiamine-phosphate synthase enzyme YjbQ [Desulfarculaceae bacterium]
MKIYRQTIELAGTAGTDVHEVTGQVAQVVAEAGVSQGMVLVFTPGSTAAVTTIEHESGCLADLRRLLDRLAPPDGEYAHNLRWGDGNGYSHLRAALLGPSLTVPVVDHGLGLGTWQQIVVLDFDNRPRSRRVIITVQGQ